MRTTWPIRDCSKVVCLFINILQNSRLPISSQLDCQFQARIKQLSQTILWDISRSGNLFTIMGLIHETEGLCQREEPLKPSHYYRISLCLGASLSAALVFGSSVRWTGWCACVHSFSLNREHYQQLMRTTWLIRDCSKVVSLFINILQKI